MEIKASVEIIKSLDKVQKDRKYFHDTDSGVLCEVIKHGTLTAIETSFEGVKDISNKLESIIVDDGLTRVALVVNSKAMQSLKLSVGDIIEIDLDKNRYSNRNGYLVIVDGKVAQDGIKWMEKMKSNN